jgi:hypothetical protein
VFHPHGQRLTSRRATAQNLVENLRAATLIFIVRQRCDGSFGSKPSDLPGPAEVRYPQLSPSRPAAQTVEE